MMNTIHPGALTNGRIGKVPCGISFGSPEQRLGSFQMDRPWETCAVVNGDSWIWNGGKNIKSINTCIQMLVGCAVGDGNLLLNFGPEPDGAITPKVRETYQGIGKFLKEYGESIYKTRGGPYKPGHWGGATRRGNTVYLHITQRWPGGVLELPPLPAKVVSATTLTGGTPAIEQTPEKLVIALGPEHHTIPDTIVKLVLDKDAMSIKPIDTLRGKTLTTDAKVTASSTSNPKSARGAPETVVGYSWETGKVRKQFGEESDEKSVHINRHTGKNWSEEKIDAIRKNIGNKHRGHFWRFWHPADDDKQPWIALDLGRKVAFSKIGIRELFGQVRGFDIQISEDGADWKTIYHGDTMDNFFVDLGEPRSARHIRFVIKGNNGESPSICMIDVFE